MAPLLVLLAALGAGSAPPQHGIILVHHDGRSEEVLGYEVEGDQVRVYELDGGERLVPRASVDIDRSDEETTAHLIRLNREHEERARDELGDALARRREAIGLTEDALARRDELEFYTAVWCRWCRRLRSEVLAADPVRDALAELRFREVDYDAERAAARAIGVTSLPCLVRRPIDGGPPRLRCGYLTAPELLEWLAASAPSGNLPP